jgi:hypothetical protein
LKAGGQHVLDYKGINTLANLSLFGDNHRFLGQFGQSRESRRTREVFLGGGGEGFPSYEALLDDSYNLHFSGPITISAS